MGWWLNTRFFMCLRSSSIHIIQYFLTCSFSWLLTIYYNNILPAVILRVMLRIPSELRSQAAQGPDSTGSWKSSIWLIVTNEKVPARSSLSHWTMIDAVDGAPFAVGRVAIRDAIQKRLEELNDSRQKNWLTDWLINLTTYVGNLTPSRWLCDSFGE